MPTLKCERCGYDLSGLSYVGNSTVCPECGQSTLRPLPEVSISHAKVWIPTLIVVGVSFLSTLVICPLAWKDRDGLFLLLLFLVAPAFGLLNWIVTATSLIVAFRRNRQPLGKSGAATYVVLGLIVGFFTALLVFLTIVVLSIVLDR